MINLKIFLGVLFIFNIYLFSQDGDNKVFVKYTNEKIILDGNSDEESWKNADIISDFIQWFPSDSLKATYPTEVQILMDDANIYLFVRAYSKNNNYVIPSLRRDFFGRGNDNFTFIFDTFDDKTNAFFFGTNPMGVKREGLLSNGGNDFRTDYNGSWDTKWQVATKIHDNHYLLEIKVPFSSLNFVGGSKKWRFNAYRFDTGSSEWTVLERRPQNQQLVNLAFMRDMIFETPLGKSKNPTYLIPYINTIASEDYELKNPHYSQITFGGDAKIPIGSNGINLDLTINPDFSQVEVDNQIVNLTRFEISLPEKRQFFIQNNDLFTNFGDFREQQPFFSRRIGIAKDKDGNTIENRILGGIRISGKLNKDLRLGFLNMQTQEDLPNEIAANNNTVLTLQQKIFERSNIAMIFINRQATKAYDFLSEEEKYNRVLGIDYNLATSSNIWAGRFWLHKSFTPTIKSNDFSGGFRIDYNTRKYRIFSDPVFIGENFQSDLGFNRRTGIMKLPLLFSYRIWSPTKKINRIELSQFGLSFFNIKDYKETDHILFSEINFQFLDRSELEFQYRKRFTLLEEEFDPTRLDEATPLAANSSYHYGSFSIRYVSDRRKALNFSTELETGSFFNGSRQSFDLNFNWRAQPYFLTTIQLSYNSIKLPQPYASADLWLITPKIDVTFSKKIFWATFIQYNTQGESLGINSRLQWRFSPLSDIFIVYNDNYLTTNDLFPKLRSINLKFTYWLNL